MSDKKMVLQKSIIETIKKIENVDMLMYLNRLIENILKAGR